MSEAVQAVSNASAQRGASSLRQRVDGLFRALSANRTNYWFSFAVDIACPVAFGSVAIGYSVGWALFVAYFCAGALLFSFIEYGWHRWYFHARGTLAASIHAGHHAHPQQLLGLPFFASALATFLLWCVFKFVLGAGAASALLCGTHAGYLWYSTLHHLQHRVRVRDVTSRWLQKRWADHAVHHGRNDCNFGVTTSLWDRAFGTHYRRRSGASE